MASTIAPGRSAVAKNPNWVLKGNADSATFALGFEADND
jgi:hypothetical protein